MERLGDAFSLVLTGAAESVPDAEEVDVNVVVVIGELVLVVTVEEAEELVELMEKSFLL